MASSPEASTSEEFFRGRTRFVVLYDGACGLCRRTVQWLVAHDPEGLLNPVPLQTAGAIEAFGISREAALRELHVVARDGERRTGSDAVLWVVSALPGYGWLGLILHVPPLRWLARVVYREVARRRVRQECADGVCHL